MKKLLLAFVLLLSTEAHAQALRHCTTLLSSTNRTTDETGSIIQFQPQNVKALSAIATASNDSGTTPTLDLKIQSCRTKTGTCVDWVSFSQCTTGSCYGDGIEIVDINRDTVNWFPYFRVVSDLAGTSPQYDYTVELCVE